MDGVCEVESEQKIQKSEDKYKSSTGCEFEYQKVTEQKWKKKQCSLTIPKFQETHEGGHQCTQDADSWPHTCDKTCPMCGYYCILPHAHSGLHKTNHGNMRLTELASSSDTFVLDQRTYGRGDSGEAEMCSFHCKTLGRGHFHHALCKEKARRKKDCRGPQHHVERRHETAKYGPNEHIPKDELTHDAFWTTIGFEDPCTDTSQFRKCSGKCLAKEHESGEPSLCSGQIWHEPFTQNDLGHLGGGHISQNGCHFKCVHSSSGPVHHVLVVDRSGSMGGSDAQPTKLGILKETHNNRLGAVIEACHDYLSKRATKADTDVVSFIQFNSSAEVLFQGRQLDPDGLLERMKEASVDGGTSFSPASTFFVCLFLKKTEEILNRHSVN